MGFFCKQLSLVANEMDNENDDKNVFDSCRTEVRQQNNSDFQCHFSKKFEKSNDFKWQFIKYLALFWVGGVSDSAVECIAAAGEQHPSWVVIYSFTTNGVLYTWTE